MRTSPTPPPPVKSLNQTLSAPAPGSRGDAPADTGTDSVDLPGGAGQLVLRVVPDDNSCLFSAIAIVFEGGLEAAVGLRKVVAEAIRNDANTWSDVVLG